MATSIKHGYMFLSRSPFAVCQARLALASRIGLYFPHCLRPSLSFARRVDPSDLGVSRPKRRSFLVKHMVLDLNGKILGRLRGIVCCEIVLEDKKNWVVSHEIMRLSVRGTF